MKAGFLGRTAAKPTATRQQAIVTQGRVELLAPASSTQHTGSPQQDTSWHQCLQLLRSDADGKKFVGLLLVTKLLPQGSDQAIQEVLDAVGLNFIKRLLLPLQQSSSSSADAAKLPQQQLSVVLGLSILSAVCRLEEVRSSDGVLHLLPLLLKVGAAGGVAPVLQQQHTGHKSAEQQYAGVENWAEPAAETAAAADALECVQACIASGSYQQLVALESNAFALVVAALQTAITASSQVSSGGSSEKPSAADAAATATRPEPSTAAAAASRVRCILVAVQVLGQMLDQSNSVDGVALQEPQATAAAVMLLSRVFGGLSTHAVTSNGTSSSSTLQANSVVDASVLQLEAQHTLLLLLPLPDGCEAAHLLMQTAGVDPQQPQHPAASRGRPPRPQLHHSSSAAAAAAAAVAGDWSAAVRHGLCQLLRSRTGVVQRHSALRLAAALADLLGDVWLLPAGQHQQLIQEPGASDVSTQSPGHFLLVLMEILAIETPLLLSDAMNPGAVVPRADMSITARPTTAAENAPQHQGDQAGAALSTAGMEGESDECMPDVAGSAEEQQPLSVQQILQQVQQQEAQASHSAHHHHEAGGSGAGGSAAGVEGPPGFQVLTPVQQRGAKSLQQRLEELTLPADKPPGPEQQVAGARADQLLPACFLLLECCCEVLVTQAALLELTADLDPHTADQNADTPGAGACAGAGPASLELKEVEQLMMRMQQVSEILLDFLELATSESNEHLVNPLLTAGAVRVLGRFLADAPEMHQEAVQRLLPRLLTVATPHEPLASGVSFLLPALLLWTSSGSSQQQWVAVLLQEDCKCLCVLAEYVSHLTAAAVVAAEKMDSSSSSSESSSSLAELTSLEARLGTACRVLQQLLGSLPFAMAQEHTAQQQLDSTRAVKLLYVPLKVLAAVLSELHAWENIRRQQQQQRLVVCSATSEAAAISSLQALLQVQLELPVLLSVAAFSGQLLKLLAAHTTEIAAGCNAVAGQETANAAGHILCWGCEVGWSFQILQTWWQHRQQQGGVIVHQDALNADDVAHVVAKICPVWAHAELGELWDVCLSAAAELLLAGFPASLSDMLESAAWVSAVMQSDAPHTVAAVTESSLGLQLLLPALRAIRP